MAQLDIREQLKARFAAPLPECAQRRIVVWHDADGEFTDVFERLAHDEGFANCTLVEVRDGNTFATKKLICRDKPGSDFLLYRQRTRVQLKDDWLADVELYAEHFQADFAAMLIENLNAADTPEVRNAVADASRFFAAKDRVAKFCRVMPCAQTADDVALGVLAVALGSPEATTNGIVRAYLTELCAQYDGEPPYKVEPDSEPPEVYRKLQKFGADEALVRLLSRVLGYNDCPFDARKIVSHLLVTALSATMPSKALVGLEDYLAPSNAQFCRGIIREWNSGSRDSQQTLYDLCEIVQRDLRLDARFGNLDVSDLIDSDIFPAINEALLVTLMQSLAAGADRREEAREVLRARREMEWYSRVQPYFNCLAEAVEMDEFYRGHAAGFRAPRARDVWNQYVNDWWRMDYRYRQFCNAYTQCKKAGNASLDQPVRDLASHVNNLYANWYLASVNRCWVSAARKEWFDLGYVEGVAQQRRFYDEVVSAELSAAKRVVVVISDAMRYEVAQQLADALERDTRGKAAVSAVQAAFPSETKYGMAALLPHMKFQYDETTDSVLLDGKPTAGIEARREILRARRPQSNALQFRDFVDLSREERKALASELEVLYVYHNTIDAAGHGEVSGQAVFDACEDAVNDLLSVAKLAVNDMGASRVVFTADHGFLYTQAEIPEVDQASRRSLVGTMQAIERRFIRADAQATSEVFVNMNMTDVDGGANIWWAAPDCVRIKAAGSKNFVHGGISLQELCVPVVRFHNLRSGAKGYVEQQFAPLRLLTTNRRITSTIFNLDFYQEQPVGGKILPCEYGLTLTDASGNAVSDTRTAHAASTEQEESLRQLRCKFTLRAGHAWKSTDLYYLVARNAQTGETCWTQEFHIEIAFAPLDDFGF